MKDRPRRSRLPLGRKLLAGVTDVGDDESVLVFENAVEDVVGATDVAAFQVAVPCLSHPGIVGQSLEAVEQFADILRCLVLPEISSVYRMILSISAQA